MPNLPSVELLKSTHSFPGPYVFKIIAEFDETLLERLVSAIRLELNWKKDPPYTTRETAKGKHIAVTFELVMQNAEEIHLVYHRLVKEKGVLLLL